MTLTESENTLDKMHCKLSTKIKLIQTKHMCNPGNIMVIKMIWDICEINVTLQIFWKVFKKLFYCFVTDTELNQKPLEGPMLWNTETLFAFELCVKKVETFCGFFVH
jgi:hypothetical protein